MAASQLNIIQKSLEDARKSLSNTDVRIERVIGRKPIDRRMMNRGRLFFAGTGAPEMMRQRTRSWNTSETEGPLPPAKRRESSGPSGRFNRSGREGGSSSEEEEEKPSLLSVVAGGKRTVSRTSRSQSDLVEKAGEKSNRNKRMLGVLMGTLNRFKVDQQRESQLGKDKKRIEIENRVEDERLAVREEMAAQRKELFTQRKSQKREVMELERKMHIVESFKEWEEHYGHLANYIKTKAKPPIYYKPKTHNKSTQELLEKHAQECKDRIAKLQSVMKDDLEGKIMSTALGLNQTSDSMDQDSQLKDQDLGELEGQPAELNITAQHEERQEEGEGEGKMDSSVSGVDGIGDSVGEGGREGEGGDREDKVSEKGPKVDGEEDDKVQVKKEPISSVGSST